MAEPKTTIEAHFQKVMKGYKVWCPCSHWRTFALYKVKNTGWRCKECDRDVTIPAQLRA